MESTQTTADILVRLEEPFASKDVKWLVAATSRDNTKGRITPYADPRAYTDRLNEVVTPSGWTRQYAVHTVSPITRMKKDKAVQSGKVLVTCIVTIPAVGTHSGSGEEWADDENAMTSAEAQAFKRACSCFGLGRYFYSFGEMWVDLNDYKQPKQLPNLPDGRCQQTNAARVKAVPLRNIRNVRPAVLREARYRYPRDRSTQR